MRTSVLTVMSLLALAACADWKQLDDGGTNSCPDQPSVCPSLPDLKEVTPCMAAKGLKGTVLGGICIDITTAADLTSKGFNLAYMAASCGGWDVISGALQPKNIMNVTANATCGLLFPSIDTGSHPRILLAVVHQGSLNSVNQYGRIVLSQTIWQTPAPFSFNQRTIVEITPGNPVQPSIELYAPGASGTPSWSISSIAVLGQPAQ